MNKVFDIEKFNIISDEDNYYFFRVLEDGDIEDLEKGVISIDENSHLSKIRTDRERWNERNKEKSIYSDESTVSLEEMFSHIKMHYSLQTNCISLSSNANVVRTYEDMFSNKYVMIKVPKREIGEKCYNAGQYMLSEVEKRINEVLQRDNIPNEILEDIKAIDEATDENVMKELIQARYKSSVKINSSKARMKDGIVYSAPHARISSYQSLDELQSLEKNKIIAKLTVLEKKKIMEPIIKNSKNNNSLVKTIGSAFSSSEQIYYGDINGEQVQSISKEIVDIFCLIQQIKNIDKNIVNDLKKEIINFVNSGKNIEFTDSNANYTVKDDISIEGMYEITKGKVEYGSGNSIVKNMFYLSRGQNDARKLANIIEQIVGNNPKYTEAIKYIKEKGFVVEPQIITRQNKKGVQLSESVNLNLKGNEKQLVEEISSLSSDEQMQIIENGGLLNTNDIITRCFSKIQEDTTIPRNRYYAEAIISQYDWKSIGIEEFKVAERNELIKRLQEKKCINIYEDLKKANISEKEIPTILLNIVTREGFYDEYINGNLKTLLNEKQDILKKNINIEIVEKFLGFYDVKNTGIRLKDYQQRAYNNINEIFQNKKFAQVILPTGAGKSFVALAQMINYANEHSEEKILYMAPQDEIIHQIKNYIVKYVHGKKDTVGKTEDELIKEVFPNIEFTTYPNLIAKGGKEIINTHYGLIIADELHRTGAKEWESSIDKLYENQNENVKVLGITATPVRDVDERDMAEETARKLGYTDDEIKHRKHIASNMTLENAIRMGYVVNPKLVYCKYDLITSGKLDQLKEKIEIIEDESKKAEELEIYNELKSKVNREIDDEIEETARKHLNSGIGKEQILRQNVKKGGKYIVFIPITNQEKIEDENGNRIGEKTGEDKIKAYQDYLTQVFKDTDITPIYNSLLGSYTKEKNRQELNEFEARITDETSFMIVMNKANEGLHIEGIDGIVWFRALDENSRILYLQQLGRAIYALDEDNPISENNRPIVIDLVNNSLTVKIEKDFKNMKSIDDLEALAIVTEWMEEHDGIFPSSTSSNKQEQHYYAILRRIQNTYNKYLNGFENFEDLDESEKEQIQEIIEIASSIDLWNVELPPIPKTKGSKNEMDPFEITGILRDYLELEEKVNSIEGKSPFEQVMQFCEREGRVPKYVNKKALKQSKEEKEEQRLYFKWLNTEERKIVDGYEGKSLEEIPEEDRELVKTMKSYGYGLTPYQEVMQFCEREGRVPKCVNKKASEQTKEEKEENSLYRKWSRTEEKKIVDSYEGKALEEIPEEDRELVKTMKSYGYGLTPYQEVMQFCEREGRVPKYVNKKASEQTKEEKEEQSLYNKWLNTEEKKIVDSYKGRALEEIPQEYRELVKTMRNYGYGLVNELTPYQEVVQFCEREGRVPKYVNKKALKQSKEEKEEQRLYFKWLNTEERKIVDGYEGKALEEIPEEDRELVRTMRSYGYGFGNGLTPYQEVVQFCEREGRVPKQVQKKVSEQTKEEKEENSLYKKWKITEEKKIVDSYKGKALEEIPQEYRELVRTMRSYGTGLTQYQEVMQFCEREGRVPKQSNKKASEQTKEEKEENSLYQKWLNTKEKKIVDGYEGKSLEEIPQEYRELVKTMRNYRYGLGNGLTPYQEVMQFCEREGRLPRTATEKNLYKKWLRTNEKKIVDSYKGRALEEIPEEDRELVKTMRSYGYGLYKKITGQDVGKASYSANVEMCDQAQEVIDNLIQKTKEGGIIHGSN